MSAMGGKYQLGERIGGGGMADVFQAITHGAEGFSRSVAVKRIKRSISTDKDFAKLFVDEARLAAKLAHPNVVQTIDFDRDQDGCFYLVMELIDGVDLRELVRSGPVPVSACVFIACEVLRALDYAHEMAFDGQSLTIVHRDISPHNIMLGWQGSVKVVDFGIAKAIAGSLISRSGSLKGKVAYMSPEQVHGHALDGRSDLFALGIVLHEILTGARLFVAESEAATLSQLLTRPIPLPSALNEEVPADLDAIVMTLLERDRERRYSRARDALEALLDCSIANAKGPIDLETVLGERFPSRVPKRVARLSTRPEGSTSRTPAAVPVAIAGESSVHATGPTVRASPEAAADLVPRRTMTAAPASRPTAAAADDPGVSDRHTQEAPSRLPLLLSLAVVLAAAAGVAYVLAAERKEGREPAIELVAIESAPAAVAPATLDAGFPAPVPDAASADDVAEEPAAELPAEPAAAAPASAVAARHKKASLTLRVKPWATVQIDGVGYGQTPQTVELRRGKHRIVLENSGLNRREGFSVTLRSGRDKSIEKDWREAPPASDP